MFLDEATIEVIGGNGGRGCVSFRREKYEPRGGPNGGDGGRGGNVFFVADDNTDTLSEYATKKRFEAQKGGFGLGKNMNGKAGEDLLLRVPAGTVVYDADSNDVLADLKHHGEQVLIARGGRGGYGNAHFKSSTRQAPDFAELGEPGEELHVRLELKLVADVGIIGFPSVGKSTLISVISSAKPKIAAYEFTTLIPNLGVVTVHGRQFVVCDVPGLIEGASEGKGLGDKFLRHVERCGILLHILDVNRENLVQDYRIIRKELAAYSPALARKREIVALNKADLAGGDVTPWVRELADAGIAVQAVLSAASKQGVDDLLNTLLPIVLEERGKRAEEERKNDEELQQELPVLKPHLLSRRMGAYRIDVPEEGVFRVEGARIEQLARMTDFGMAGGVQRFKDVVERTGLRHALERAGAGDASTVYIGDTDVSAHWR